MRPANLALLSSALILIFAASAAAQSPAQPAAPTLKVYSRETIVDVTVTDAKGNPVHGLTRDDFTVKEDNKPQPIRSFEEYDSKPVVAPPKLPPNDYTNLQPPPASSATNILWLDFTNLAPTVSLSALGGQEQLSIALQVQHRVKQSAIQYLATMPVGTRITVLGSSSTGLRVLQAITSDPALLSAAIDTMAYDTDAVASNRETMCSQLEQRNRMTLETLGQMAADLAAIKGRKNLIWFTHGVPTITNPAQRPPCLSDYGRDLQKAYGLLTAAQVTIYPVGAAGVPAPPEPPDDWLSMEAVAEATGGTAFYNNNDLGKYVAEAIDSGSEYYTLSYVPPGTEYDGRHHTIKIATDRPDLHLTHRDEYYAEDPAKMTPTPGLTLSTTPPEVHAGDLKAAMSRNMPLSTQIIFRVYVEPAATAPGAAILGTLDPKLRNKPLTRYSFLYNFPAKAIAFSSDPDGTRHGTVDLNIAAYDADGKLVTGLSQTVSMPLSDARYQEFIKGPFRFFQQLDLPSGPLFLRFGVVDPASNKVGTLEIPLTVPKK